MQELVSRSLSLLGREAAKIVLPSDCIVCTDPLPWSDRVASCCAACWERLPKIEETKCRRCAFPWSGSGPDERFVCLDCMGRDWSLSWIDSWGHYRDGLEKMMSAFKFGRHDFLARPLGERLVETLEERADVFFDQIVPIPMHPRRERRRGYNQSERLASSVSGSILVPMKRSLRKRAENRVQSRLPRVERASNVRDIFEVRQPVAGDRVLLVDDICTTGETLDAAARELLRNGAASVCALTVARA